MSWTDAFPVFDDDKIAEFESNVTASDRRWLDEMCGVEKVINPRAGKHVVSTSLFWKNARKAEDELPVPTRRIMKNAGKLGLVTRFSPWEHYVEPLLEGAGLLRKLRPDVVFRVYLAADLGFLIRDLVSAGCEVVLMKGSSLRHNPGAMWRFLALEEEGRWVTITDADRAHQVFHDVLRTERIMEAGLGFWRVPYIYDSISHGNDPGYYRPVAANQFGAAGGYSMTLLMKAFLWHTARGSMPDYCSLPGMKGKKRKFPIFGTDWPTYGFDEWFLIAAVYPRVAMSGVLTFLAANEAVNQWFAHDIEYVTWANPRSEILCFGKSKLLEEQSRKQGGGRSAEWARSPILQGMLEEKARERETRVAFPLGRARDRLTLVVARYEEDIGWLLKLPKDIALAVYNKGGEIKDKRLLKRIDHLQKLPNRGRESDTYLHHLQNYPHGEDGEWTAFCQGDPFPHSPDFPMLLERRMAWGEVQVLTAGYAEHCDVPPATSRQLDDAEWIDGIPVRSELCSAHTLDILGWQDEAGGRRFFKDYFEHHRLIRGMSISGHFLESCGLVEVAEKAWRSAMVQFAYGAMFAVRNDRLSLVPKRCIPRMRRLACGHYSNGYVFERLWLHIFGLPFIDVGRSSVEERLFTPRHRLEA